MEFHTPASLARVHLIVWHEPTRRTGFLVRLVRACRRSFAQRRTLNELRGLDPRTLKDIGLTPADLYDPEWRLRVDQDRDRAAMKRN